MLREREYERETLQWRNSAHLFLPCLVRVVAMALPMGTVVMPASPCVQSCTEDPCWSDSHPQSFTDLHLREHTHSEPVETRSDWEKGEKREWECLGTLHEFIKNGKQTVRWKKIKRMDRNGTEKAMFRYLDWIQLVMWVIKFVLKWDIFFREFKEKLTKNVLCKTQRKF